MAHIPYEFVSHKRKVQSLYKRVLLDIRAWNTVPDRSQVRILSVLMRQKFEENRHIRDPFKAKQLLEEAEQKLRYIRHPDPPMRTRHPDGPGWEKEDVAKKFDWQLDYWHPVEKAQYPEYFARREQRKKEFVEWYEKKYGKPEYEEVTLPGQ